MTPSPMRHLLLSVLVVAGLASAAGCSDVVDPTVGTDQVFSLYGYLDPAADHQAIRVVPIGATIGADTSRTINATVTSEELGTGQTVAWRDSVVTYRNGTVGHVFVADYTPTPRSRVALTVTAGDGRVASVEVEVPPLVRSEIGEPFNVGGFATYPVTVRDVPRVIGGTLRLDVVGLPAAPDDTTTIEIPIRTFDIRQEGADWTVAVPFVQATQAYLQSINLFGSGLKLVEAEFAAFVANDEWAIPRGGLDEEAIAEPGTFSNVDGGFGFVGAGYEAPVRWVPSPGAQSRAGFMIGSDRAGLLVVNEVGPGFVELYNPSLEAVDLVDYTVSMGPPGEGVVLPSPSVVEGRGFLVVNGPFAATAEVSVSLFNPLGALISRTFVEEESQAWGSYPDGLSYALPQGGPDIFRGPLAPTPGGPNRPAVVPAVINEISTGGTGFVEVLPTAESFLAARLSSDPREIAFNGVPARGAGTFLVADEGGSLALEQTGGTVYLLASFSVGADLDGPTALRVVDARTYGPQTPGRSLGYLPDGPNGAWSEGLLPTRGAPNATARFGL
ncbi:hypothetical protein [Rubrivirga sp.]|uniref:hypothetical protein n=1 Tax=Rubrivirga sp. TaxID=1885344 RepID=UPI003B520E64